MNERSNFRAAFTFVTGGLLVLCVSACSSSGTNQPSNTLNSVSMVLSEVQSKLAPISSSVRPSPMDLWWISELGYSIINDNSPGIEAQFPGCVADDPDHSMWKASVKEVVTAVDAVMLENGFKVDIATNSSTSLSDTRFYDFIKAYYRGKTKAVLSISPDCGSTSQTDNPEMYYSAKFGYTDGFQKNYDRQAPFLRDLKLKDVIVHIQKSDGQFSLLAINYRRSGHATIVKRIDKKWTEVWSGQDLISCEVRDKNEIPFSIAGECY